MHTQSQEGGISMVKGVSRRVVVVEPDEKALFDQAIFLVRDYTMPRGELVREACRIADGYLKKRPRRRFSRRQLVLSFAFGAVIASLFWALLLICK